MADNTSKMISLLGALRREMNGAVADSMGYYGTRYGLNYGVSLPTIRSIAAKEPKNNDLALYLFKQDVRELRLAALHIAEPQAFDSNITTWMEGITTSEIAEEMAFALLCHVDSLSELYQRLSLSSDELPTYSLLMAAARNPILKDDSTIETLPEIILRHPFSCIIAQGAVAMLSAALPHHHLEKIKSLLAALPQSKAAEYIIDEMTWRME